MVPDAAEVLKMHAPVERRPRFKLEEKVYEDSYWTSTVLKIDLLRDSYGDFSVVTFGRTDPTIIPKFPDRLWWVMPCNGGKFVECCDQRKRNLLLDFATFATRVNRGLYLLPPKRVMLPAEEKTIKICPPFLAHSNPVRFSVLPIIQPFELEEKEDGSLSDFNKPLIVKASVVKESEIATLTPEIWAGISVYLSARDLLCELSSVCKKYYRFFRSYLFWGLLYDEDDHVRKSRSLEVLTGYDIIGNRVSYSGIYYAGNYYKYYSDSLSKIIAKYAGVWHIRYGKVEWSNLTKIKMKQFFFDVDYDALVMIVAYGDDHSFPSLADLRKIKTKGTLRSRRAIRSGYTLRYDTIYAEKEAVETCVRNMYAGWGRVHPVSYVEDPYSVDFDTRYLYYIPAKGEILEIGWETYAPVFTSTKALPDLTF